MVEHRDTVKQNQSLLPRLPHDSENSLSTLSPYPEVFHILPYHLFHNRETGIVVQIINLRLHSSNKGICPAVHEIEDCVCLKPLYNLHVKPPLQ